MDEIEYECEVTFQNVSKFRIHFCINLFVRKQINIFVV